MKLSKIILTIITLVILSHSQSFNLNKQWNLLGTTEYINDLSIFDNTCISKIFTYNKSWDSYHRGGELKSLKKGKGFWAYTNDNCSINTKKIDINKNTVYENCDYRSTANNKNFKIENPTSVNVDKCYIYVVSDNILIYSKQDFSLINYISNVERIIDIYDNIMYYTAKDVHNISLYTKEYYLKNILAYNKNSNIVKPLDINYSDFYDFKTDDNYIYSTTSSYANIEKTYLNIVDKKTYKSLFSIIDENYSLSNFIINDNNIYLLYSSDNKIKVFNKRDRNLIQVIELPDDAKSSTLFVADGYIYVGGHTALYVISQQDTSKIQEIKGYKDFVSEIKVDDKYIYASSKDEIKIWNKRENKFVATLDAKPKVIKYSDIEITLYAPIDIDEHYLYYINKDLEIETWKIK